MKLKRVPITTIILAVSIIALVIGRGFVIDTIDKGKKLWKSK